MSTIAIVFRGNVDGQRSWRVVKGSVSHGNGSYYTRHRAEGKNVFTLAGTTYEEAEIAAMNLEARLEAEANGLPAPEQAAVPAGKHRCEQILQAYLTWLRDPTTKKRKDNRCYRPKGIQERESDVRAFLTFSKRGYVESIRREDLLAWKRNLSHLSGATICSKFSSVTTWLAKNPVISITGLLKREDWPPKTETEPKPYEPEEVAAMFAAAKPGKEHLLLRFAYATGMRKMEIAHAERADIEAKKPNTISVRPKLKWYDWEPKTTAGIREITLDPDLKRDLLALPDGLFFPNVSGQPDVHIDRIFEEIAQRAGIKRPDGVMVGWVHRWRHTTATELVANQDISPLEILKQMGWTDYAMIRVYAKGNPSSPQAVRAATRRAIPRKGEQQ